MLTLEQIKTNINNNFSTVTDLIPNKFNFADEPVNWTDPNTPDFDFYGWADVVFIQADGKILVGGQSGLYDSDLENNYSIVKRFNVDGSLDNTFNSVKFHGSYNGFIRDIGQQPDGKLIIVGHFTYVDGNSQNRIARLNTDGSLDNTFNIGNGFNGNALVCKVLSDGCILVGGNFSSYNSTGNSKLLKLNSNGTINSTFAGNAHITSGYVHAIEVDSSNGIYAGGGFSNSIIKLNYDGTTDGSFDPGYGFGGRVTAIKIQDDGKLIVGGWFNVYKGSSCNPQIVRLETNGDIDGSFYSDGDGLNFWSGNLGVQALEIQEDGKIVAVGWFIGYNYTVQKAIVRLYSDGTIDSSFSSGTGFSDRAQDVKIDSDGNIFVAGMFYYYNGLPCTQEFNYLDSKQSGGVVKLSSTGTLLGAPLHQDIKPIGVEDGERDMFDSGLYINSNISQLYPDINSDLSLPFTHSVLFFCDASEGIDFATYDVSIDNYSYDATPLDGFTVAGDNYFNVGSKYFTNQYPGLFVMGADKIGINQLSLTGGTGKDTSGDYATGSFDVTVYGKTYGVFYITTYGNNDTDETNIQQIIIVDKSSKKIAQKTYDPSNYMDQILSNSNGAKKAFVLVFACNNLDDNLSEDLIGSIATTFLNVAMNETDPRRPISPKLIVKIKTYDPVKLQSQVLPDNNRENIINQLKNQTVWIPNWNYALKDGDVITLRGQQAIQLYKDVPYMNNGGFNVAEVLYYGPDIEEKSLYIFINSDYVDYVENPGTSSGHEANNLIIYMNSASIKFTTFTDISENSWADVASKTKTIVIPEIEESDLLPDLTTGARNQINSFVNKGGNLVMFNPNNGDVIELLNTIFGFNLDTWDYDVPFNLTSAGSTLFPGLSSTLPYNNGTSAIHSTTLPVDAVIIYEGDGSEQALVVQIPYGSGKIYILGWDWYDAAPQGSQDGGWNDLLQRILES